MAVRQDNPRRAFLGFLLGACSQMALAEEACCVYDPDPQHLWNRLHETLFIRVADDGTRYGCDRIDPLYWYDTRKTLEPSSHRAAIRVLGEFLATGGEQLAPGPLERALLQHDLWMLFDWTARHPGGDAYEAERKALQVRLAPAIHSLALTPAEVAALPDNAALTRKAGSSVELPEGLLEPGSSWVSVRAAGAVAPIHRADFGGRSAFEVYLRLPNGREATLAYLDGLRAAARSSYDQLLLPGIPQFPTGTQWALVRRLMVLDSAGEIRSTPVIESIQLRTYDVIADHDDRRPNGVIAQRFTEFVARREDGLLRRVLPGELDFLGAPFQSLGIDPIEWATKYGQGESQTEPRREVLRQCGKCHSEPGIRSVRSIDRLLVDPEGRPVFSLREKIREAKPGQEAETTAAWKRAQPDFALLQGLWRSD